MSSIAHPGGAVYRTDDPTCSRLPKRRVHLGFRTRRRADASNGAPAIAAVCPGQEPVFTTGAGSAEGRNLRRDARIALVVDEDVAPYAFVPLRGRATISENINELLRFATEIGGRYTGPERAPGELLVRVTSERIIAETVPAPSRPTQAFRP